jgi:serine/threonine protein phosphatase PrpC
MIFLSFESMTSFSAIPLHPVPRGLSISWPLVSSEGFIYGPLERGFLSGSLERGFLSRPLERGFSSGPLERGYKSGPMDSMECSGSLGCKKKLRRNHSVSRVLKSMNGPLNKVMSRMISKSVMLSISRSLEGSLVRNTSSMEVREWVSGDVTSMSSNGDLSLDDTSSDSFGSENIHWAQGKAGEDKVHVVISEEHGWLFVGIYDGFNGPDAPDYLLKNLYTSIYRELRGLIWDCPSFDKPNTKTKSKHERKSEELQCHNYDQDSTGSVRVEEIGDGDQCCTSYSHEIDNLVDNNNLCLRKHMQRSCRENGHGDPCKCEAIASSKPPTERNFQGYDKTTRKSKTKQIKGRLKGMPRKWKESQRKWKHEWNQERLELDKILKGDLHKDRQVEDQEGSLDNFEVLKALARALSKTKEAYLEMVDKAVAENPKLALMGSCVLVMLMKGEDVYVMNVGDS